MRIVTVRIEKRWLQERKNGGIQNCITDRGCEGGQPKDLSCLRVSSPGKLARDSVRPGNDNGTFMG